jgi:hypothetical protein
MWEVTLKSQEIIVKNNFLHERHCIITLLLFCIKEMKDFTMLTRGVTVVHECFAWFKKSKANAVV